MLWTMRRRPMRLSARNKAFVSGPLHPEPSWYASVAAGEFADATSVMAEGGPTWLLERYDWMFDHQRECAPTPVLVKTGS